MQDVTEKPADVIVVESTSLGRIVIVEGNTTLVAVGGGGNPATHLGLVQVDDLLARSSVLHDF